MSQQLYSVEQVADLLGLHVKTVRGYVHDGRLKAVRIGRQYRITQDDLEAFTGHTVAGPARETARRQRRVEISSIVQIDVISPDEMTRVSNSLMAATNRPDGGAGVHIETLYDAERASLKIVLLGDLDTVVNLLRMMQPLLEDRA